MTGAKEVCTVQRQTPLQKNEAFCKKEAAESHGEQMQMSKRNKRRT
jgi:hypothetical protein